MIDNSWPACTGNADGIEPLNCHRHRLAEKNNQFRAGRRLETSHTCPASPRTVVQLSRSAPLPRLPRSRTGSLCSVLPTWSPSALLPPLLLQSLKMFASSRSLQLSFIRWWRSTILLCPRATASMRFLSGAFCRISACLIYYFRNIWMTNYH